VVNVGRKGEHREVVHAIAATLAQGFAYVRAADPPVASSTILVATDHAPAEDLGIAGLAVTPATRIALEHVAAPLAPLAPATWPEGTAVFTDDHAPVEWLTDRVLWETFRD
jgi:hypothetical protein